MRRSLLALAVLVAALGVSRPAAAQDAPTGTGGEPPRARIRVGILAFSDASGSRSRLGETAAGALADKLQKTERFSLVDREHNDLLMKQLLIDASGRVDATSAKEVGKLAGVQYVAYGAVLSSRLVQPPGGRRGTVQLSVRFQIVDLESGEIWKEKEVNAADGVDGPGDVDPSVSRALHKAAGEFVQLLLARQGYVVRVDSSQNRVAVNLGSSDGLHKGTLLQISRKGEPIKDRSGKIIGYDTVKLCVGRVTDAQENLAFVELGKLQKMVFGSGEEFRADKRVLDQVQKDDDVELLPRVKDAPPRREQPGPSIPFVPTGPRKPRH